MSANCFGQAIPLSRGPLGKQTSVSVGRPCLLSLKDVRRPTSNCRRQQQAILPPYIKSFPSQMDDTNLRSVSHPPSRRSAAVRVATLCRIHAHHLATREAAKSFRVFCTMLIYCDSVLGTTINGGGGFFMQHARVEV